VAEASKLSLSLIIAGIWVLCAGWRVWGVEACEMAGRRGVRASQASM